MKSKANVIFLVKYYNKSKTTFLNGKQTSYFASAKIECAEFIGCQIRN